MALKEDPHFEQVHNELQEIQTAAEKLMFYSVFIRLPNGVSEHHGSFLSRHITMQLFSPEQAS